MSKLCRKRVERARERESERASENVNIHIHACRIEMKFSIRTYSRLQTAVFSASNPESKRIFSSFSPQSLSLYCITVVIQRKNSKKRKIMNR